MKTTIGRRRTPPRCVCGRSALDADKVERKGANPAAAMSGPKWLAGRCHQVISPQMTYERVIQATRRARATSGVRSSGASRMMTADTVAAAPPSAAIAQSAAILGARGSEASAISTEAEVAVSSAPFRPTPQMDGDLPASTASASANADEGGASEQDTPVPALVPGPPGHYRGSSSGDCCGSK